METNLELKEEKHCSVGFHVEGKVTVLVINNVILNFVKYHFFIIGKNSKVL